MNEEDKARAELWIELMRRGRFAAALEIDDELLKKRRGRTFWHLERHFQPVWDGTPLEGKRVLVRCYHGLGDTLQFARYLPVLREIAREVTVWAQPPLTGLIGRSEICDRVIPLHDGSPEADYDADVEIMELRHVFRTTLGTIPSRVPYLTATAHPFANRPAVGLVWESGGWDDRRSIPFEIIKPLARVSGIGLHVIQQEPWRAGWKDGYGILLGGKDLDEDASIIAGLDLLISVDTMTAHLAGALGTHVWTLLPEQADWRWMRDRDDSPWYPTMRLFRQERQGDWSAVIHEVTVALKTLASSAPLSERFHAKAQRTQSLSE